MLDHLSLAVADVERSRRFYDAVLKPLGAARQMDVDLEDYAASGWGTHPGEPAFWVGVGKPAPGAQPVPVGQHVAFAAPSRAAVDTFYRTALGSGAADNGPPGIRAHYHPNYYAAFVIDPDGHHIEAVCHRPA